MAIIVWDDALEERIAETPMRRYEAAYGRKMTGTERYTCKAFGLGTASLVLSVLAECGLIERKEEHGANHGH